MSQLMSKLEEWSDSPIEGTTGFKLCVASALELLKKIDIKRKDLK